MHYIANNESLIIKLVVGSIIAYISHFGAYSYCKIYMHEGFVKDEDIARLRRFAPYRYKDFDKIVLSTCSSLGLVLPLYQKQFNHEGLSPLYGFTALILMMAWTILDYYKGWRKAKITDE